SSTTRGLSRRWHRGHDVPRYPAGGENYHQENLVVGGVGQSDRLPQFSVELRRGGLGADEAGAVDHVHQVRRPEARGESPISRSRFSSPRPPTGRASPLGASSLPDRSPGGSARNLVLDESHDLPPVIATSHSRAGGAAERLPPGGIAQ